MNRQKGIPGRNIEQNSSSGELTMRASYKSGSSKICFFLLQLRWVIVPMAVGRCSDRPIYSLFTLIYKRIMGLPLSPTPGHRMGLTAGRPVGYTFFGSRPRNMLMKIVPGFRGSAFRIIIRNIQSIQLILSRSLFLQFHIGPRAIISKAGNHAPTDYRKTH